MYAVARDYLRLDPDSCIGRKSTKLEDSRNKYVSNIGCLSTEEYSKGDSPPPVLQGITQREAREEEKVEQGSNTDPKVWGPPYWYTLHVSAAHYPMNPSPIVRERMKGRILAIPYEIPCQKCRVHAVAFVEKNRENLDKVVSSRHDLGRFYMDFHNQVNKRYNKPEWTYEQVLKKYS